MTKREKSVAKSEYLSCNGLERFVVSYVGRFPDIYRRHRPWNAQEPCLRELVDDANEHACPTTFEEIRKVVEHCIKRGWIEWAKSRASEHILRRTERGNRACGYGPDGNSAFHTATITDPQEAIRTILEILYTVKHDPERRFRGDPRVSDGGSSNLYGWSRHSGVSRELYLDAESECQGAGFIAGTPCGGGVWYRITSRGEQYLQNEAIADPEQVRDVWNSLSDRQRNCMRALLDMNAFDADSRRTSNDIAPKAEGLRPNVEGFKEPLANLVHRGLLKSKKGSRGGYWLSESGRKLVRAHEDQAS